LYIKLLLEVIVKDINNKLSHRLEEEMDDPKRSWKILVLLSLLSIEGAMTDGLLNFLS
jgi:hypothetical protein